jgi:ATP-independent RNA helicase DbpA
MQKKQFSLPNILAALKIDELNEMQVAALEANKDNNDMVILADTGSGKTLGFLLPVLELLDSTIKKTQALIVVPSRELALQIEQVFRTMATGYKVTCCYGGHKREIEENSLLEAPSLIIGTPGRLGDHIRRGNIQTDSIKVLILDEFDKSLEMGFQEEVAFIIGSLKNISKRILTSATEAVDVPEFVGLENPKRLDFLSGEVTEALAIQVVRSEDVDKLGTLIKLICFLGNRSTIIFCNHRDAVERTSQYLKDNSITNVFYHGALEQRDRESALAKFRNGTSNILVTTDLASRGLDIPNIRYIVHFHLPTTEEVFTHRNGRTARMEASGTAILVIAPDEKVPEYVDKEVKEIELPDALEKPEKPKWSTLYISAGKKDKVNKVDIVGFFTNKGDLKMEDIGLIEVKDFLSFVAIRRSKVSYTLNLIKNEKIKGRKIKIDIAK